MFLIKFTLPLTLILSPLAASLALTEAQVEAAEAIKVVERIASWEDTIFRIDDAKSRVSFAAVKLSVSDLKPKDGNLVGEYTIRVPLMESKNDHGKIVLPLDISMDELDAAGGTLRGEAISHKGSKEANTIVCRIYPGEDQMIELDITTSKRTVHFESRYKIVEQSKDS